MSVVAYKFMPVNKSLPLPIKGFKLELNEDYGSHSLSILLHYPGRTIEQVEDSVCCTKQSIAAMLNVSGAVASEDISGITQRGDYFIVELGYPTP